MNITKKQQLVLDAINEVPKAADDDSLLYATVWKREGWSDTRSLEDNLRRVTRAATLDRRRRELYNMGLISYSDKALDERTEAYKSERDYASESYLFPSSETWLDKLTVKRTGNE